jgi:group I intron endonuclease
MIIYLTTNLSNGKIYIGQYVGKRKDYLGSGVALRSTINKYGKEYFCRMTLCECETQKELDEMEGFYISLFQSNNRRIGYNILPGTANGFAGGHPTSIKEVREKISISLKKTYNENPEKCKEHSERVKIYFSNIENRLFGEKNGMFGKQHSREWKLRMSEVLKIFHEQNPIYKEKLSIASKKGWEDLSVEKRQERIRKAAKTKEKFIIQYSFDFQYIRVYKSLIKAQEKTGLHRSNISACSRGISSQCGGFKWEKYTPHRLIELVKIKNGTMKKEKIIVNIKNTIYEY